MRKIINCLLTLVLCIICVIGLYPTIAKYVSYRNGKIGDIEFNYFYVKLEDVNENHARIAQNIVEGLKEEPSSGNLTEAIRNRINTNYATDRNDFGSIAYLGGGSAQSKYCLSEDGDVLTNMHFLIEFDVDDTDTTKTGIDKVNFYYIYLFEGEIGVAGTNGSIFGYHTYIINMAEDTDGNLIVDPYQYNTGYSSKDDLIGNSKYINSDGLNYGGSINKDLTNDEYHWMPEVSRTKVVRDSVDTWVIDESIMGHAQADWYDENQDDANINLTQRPSWEPSSWHSGTVDNCSVVTGEHSLSRYNG